MTSSHMSTSLLDPSLVYHQELCEFLASRSISTGDPDDVAGFIDRLRDPELQEEIGCLLRSIVFREDGQVPDSFLSTLLVEVVGGPRALLKDTVSSHTARKLSALTQQAISGLGSSVPAAPLMDSEEEMAEDLPTYLVVSQVPGIPEDNDTSAQTTAAVNGTVAEGTKKAAGKQTAGVLPFLQKFYWIPAGVASIVAAALCIYLPQGPEQHPASPAQVHPMPGLSGVAPIQQPVSVRSSKAEGTPLHAVARTTASAASRPRTPRPSPTPLPQALPAAEVKPPAPLPIPGEVLLGTSGLVASHLLYAPAPEYPLTARIEHLQGTVTLRLLIDRAGMVSSTQVLRGAAPLADAAVRAVESWRYRPFVMDGTAQIATLVTITFRLPL